MERPSYKHLTITPSSSSVFRLNVQLHCTKANQNETEVVTFESPPDKVLDLKQKVEKEFNVPVCVQVVSYDGQTLSSDIKLSSLSIRDGDTICVECPDKGDCSEILPIISWLKEILSTFAAHCEENLHVNDLVEYGMEQNLPESLREFFVYSPQYPASRASVNKLFFADNEGVSVMLKIYGFLLQKRWNETDDILKWLECWIILLLAFFRETVSYSRLLVQHKIISMLTQSVLREKLEIGMRIYDDTGSANYMLSYVITISLSFISGLTEKVPECRLEVASNRDILHQATCISLSPCQSIDTSIIIAAFFSNLAFSPETHKHIADWIYLERLFQACTNNSSDPEFLPLLEFYTVFFVMELCLMSPHCLAYNPLQLKLITTKIEAFLCANSYKNIRDIETKKMYSCAVFLPCVKLAYVPNTPQAEETAVGKLQLVSFQLLIFSLQAWLSREKHRQILLKEGLLDYVVCMPQYVPPSLRPQAEELVQMVVSSPDVPEGPPKLLNLVKAKLAKMHFGLELVLSLSVGEILAKI